MTLQGYYTDKGRALAAKIAAGTTALTVTHVDAGSGHTEDIASATILPDTEQTLTVGTAVVEGVTATLPVTLVEVSAVSSYSLTELGVYASDPDEGEILFQVYQLDSAADITAGGEGVLRFYLRQSIGAQGVTVVCSGAGLLVDEDLAPTRGKVMALSAPSRTVTVAPSGLQDYLDALPRLLTEHLTIQTSGTLTGHLVIGDLYGSGSLTIKAADGAFTLTSDASEAVIVRNCALPVTLMGLTIHLDEQIGDSMAAVFCKETGQVIVMDCSLFGNDRTASGVVSAYSYGPTIVYNSSIKNFNMAVRSQTAGYIVVRPSDASQFSGNVIGAYLNDCAVVLLSAVAPETLGGASNENNGGLLTRYLTQL